MTRGNQHAASALGPTASHSSALGAEPAVWMPLVTIAIPTFNRSHLLAGCVHAALAQSYRHFEVLVSDNASNDQTADVLAAFEDPRLRVVRQRTNIGLLPNWNACLAEAKGDYVVYVSDDDRIDPRFLELCISAMDGRTEIPIVVSLSNIHIDALNQTRPPRKSRILHTGVHDGGAVLREFLADEITVTNCSVMARTNLLRENGGFSLHLPYTADVAAWAPLLLRGPAGFVNVACATCRLHDTSESSRLSIEMRLQDGCKAAEIIGCAIDPFVTSPLQRKHFRGLLRKHFARRNLIVISDYCKSSNGRLLQVVWLLCRYRSYLWPMGIAAAARFVAVMACPLPLANRLRRMRRTVEVPIA